MNKHNDYLGLSLTIENESDYTPKPLTPSDVRKAFKYLSSKEYQERCMKADRVRLAGHTIAQCALNQGIITEYQYMKMLEGIAFNGFLGVSSEMSTKLQSVKLPEWLEKLQDNPPSGGETEG